MQWKMKRRKSERKRFAFVPLCFWDGNRRTWLWLEPYLAKINFDHRKNKGEYGCTSYYSKGQYIGYELWDH